MIGFLRKKAPPSKEFSGHSDQAFGHITYAQCGEDMYLANIFALLRIEKPTYLDVGGHHPLVGSNTAWLYKRGSRGVVVEANPQLIDPFIRERPHDRVLNIGVGSTRGKLPFYRIGWDSGRNSFSKDTIEACLEEFSDSKIDDVLNIEVLTINDVVDQYCDGRFPDFLSIDTEGLDAEILASADFTRSQPKVICAEVRTGHDTDAPDKISATLKQHGYVPYARTWGNGIYVHSEFNSALLF